MAKKTKNTKSKTIKHKTAKLIHEATAVPTTSVSAEEHEILMPPYGGLGNSGIAFVDVLSNPDMLQHIKPSDPSLMDGLSINGKHCDICPSRDECSTASIPADPFERLFILQDNLEKRLRDTEQKAKELCKNFEALTADGNGIEAFKSASNFKRITENLTMLYKMDEVLREESLRLSEENDYYVGRVITVDYENLIQEFYVLGQTEDAYYLLKLDHTIANGGNPYTIKKDQLDILQLDEGREAREALLSVARHYLAKPVDNDCLGQRATDKLRTKRLVRLLEVSAMD